MAITQIFVYICLGRPLWVGAKTKRTVSVQLGLVCCGCFDVGSRRVFGVEVRCICETRVCLIVSLRDQL